MEEAFKKHLDILEMFYNVSFQGRTEIDRLVSLHNLCIADPSMIAKAKDYGVLILKSIRINGDDDNSYGKDLSRLVADTLFACLLSGMGISNDLTNSSPKRHHWLPVSYLRGFSDESSILRSKRTRAVVNSVVCQPYGMLNVPVVDREFCHDFDEFDGAYYDQSVEAFFGFLESMYPNCLINSELRSGVFEEVRSVVSSLAFFVAQSARNPLLNGGFARGDLRNILTHIMTNGNKVLDDGVFAVFGKSSKNKPLLFSPYIPQRMRVRNSKWIMFVAMSSDQSLVLSSEPVSKDEANSFTASSRDSMIRYAREKNLVLFGAKSDQL